MPSTADSPESSSSRMTASPRRHTYFISVDLRFILRWCGARETSQRKARSRGAKGVSGRGVSLLLGGPRRRNVGAFKGRLQVSLGAVEFLESSNGWEDAVMGDVRRSSPEPPWGGPQVVHTPGMADDLMREIAPLLAEDGIDLDDPASIPDQERLQRALDRAIERRNVALFTPVGEARSVALTTLRLYVEAIASDQTELAGAILGTAQPEPADDSVASVAGTIGVALDLLDTILSGRHPESPVGLGGKVRLPKGHWVGERAARDIVDLARKGRSFDALHALITKQGSPAVQSGAALALAALMQAWSDLTGTPVDQITPLVFR